MVDGSNGNFFQILGAANSALTNVEMSHLLQDGDTFRPFDGTVVVVIERGGPEDIR
jgi:hypothetical protein